MHRSTSRRMKAGDWHGSSFSDIDPDLPLDVELWGADGRLAHNDYDLTFYDVSRGMPLRQRLRRRVADWLISA